MMDDEQAHELRIELKRAYAALNTALAHIEGRRGIFSTRHPRTVAAILREVLGEEVNEDRGTAGRLASDK